MKKLNLVIGLAAALGAGAAFANGSVKGTIGYTGAPVKAEMLKRKGDAFCAKKEFADETIAVSKDGKALVATGGGFSPEARAAAEGAPLELLDGATLLSLVKKHLPPVAVARHV